MEIMSDRSRIPNSSHKILNRVLYAMLNSKSNPDVEFWIGEDVQWNYENFLYLKLDNQFNDQSITVNITHDKATSIDQLDDSKSWDLMFIEAHLNKPQLVFNSIIPALKSLSNNGTLLYILHNLSALQVLEKTGLLKENNIYPSSVLQLPKGFYGNYSGLTPILVSFEKQKPLNLVCFIEYSEDEEGDNLLWYVGRHKSGWSFESEEDLDFHRKNSSRSTNYLIDELVFERFQEDNDLKLGILEHLLEFPGFESWKFMTLLGKTNSDYKAFKRLNLKDVVTEINLNRETFTHKEHSVYIALIGKQKAVISLDEITVKHQNVCQVIVDRSQILETYLAAYLNSHWGKIFWEAAIKSKPGTIQRLTKNDIANLVISIPSLDMQEEIHQASYQVESVINELQEIKKSLTINPISSEKERKKLDQLSEIVSGFEPMLREEGKSYEFKASFQEPYPAFPEPEVDDNGQTFFKIGKEKLNSKKQVKEFIQFQVIKSVASLINTVGGTLVIGIYEKDNIKELVGIEREGFESQDKYERHLAQILTNKLGQVNVSEYVTIRFEDYEGLNVCIVNCKKYTRELVLLDDAVYRRTGPLIEKLTTQQVLKLMRQN